MRRGVFSEAEKRLISKVEYEHELFMSKMLLNERKEIYSRCNEIRFVECVYEYFIYKEDIPNKYLNALNKIKHNIFSRLFQTYLKNEYTKVGTWEDIEELLEVFIREETE